MSSDIILEAGFNSSVNLGGNGYSNQISPRIADILINQITRD